MALANHTRLGCALGSVVRSHSAKHDMSDNTTSLVTVRGIRSAQKHQTVSRAELKHPPDIEARFYCPQAFLTLELDCRMDISEQMF